MAAGCRARCSGGGRAGRGIRPGPDLQNRLGRRIAAAAAAVEARHTSHPSTCCVGTFSCGGGSGSDIPSSQYLWKILLHSLSPCQHQPPYLFPRIQSKLAPRSLERRILLIIEWMFDDAPAPTARPGLGCVVAKPSCLLSHDSRCGDLYLFLGRPADGGHRSAHRVVL